MRVVGSRGTIFQPMWNFQSFRGFPHLSSSMPPQVRPWQNSTREGGVEARKARYQVPWGPCEKVGDVLGCVELVILWKMMEIM